MTHKRKKPIWKRFKHRLKTLWRKYWPILFAIVLGLFVAFFVTPALIRYFSESD
jgi:polyferredoxin